MEYKPTIGLEIHAELKTRTKMFCGCKNDPNEERPNTNICPVCMAHPGTLPVINKEAVRQVLRVGVALGGELALKFSEFDRKNYFYPDISKGYQISQYKYPLVAGGELAGVAITRVHLEEDTATSKHRGDHSLVDFNRAGVPLMELVTEPVINLAKQAGDFARELQLLLRYLNASDANMEKGEMRVEANISVSKDDKFGTKVEVKNLNSFKIAEKAIEYEIKRQQEVLEAGEEVVQETRGWDETKGATFSQRKKESSHDYRYFPEPDLPKLKLGEVEEFKPESLLKTLPELPWQKRERYRKDYGIKESDIEILVADPVLDEFFEAVVADLGRDKQMVQLAANYLISDVLGKMKVKADLGLPPHADFTSLIKLVAENEVSSRGAKDILEIMLVSGEATGPKKIAEEKGLFQQSDTDALGKIIDRVIDENQKAADEYRAGKETALQFLVGQGMRLSKGSANPGVLKELLVEKLT
ncbi:MAG: Asp-tRNA(Asn)/Glu-tRNA(Gln) amidotransferase subunit GatB [Patescibacteria group bacterium]|nr:Asp-tRNA(Asn)/Glu-tRNA(Gln) amidotransferase subunit GatB [Patescibacteria group bacterium]